MLNAVVRHLFILLTKILTGASVRWVDCAPDTCQRVYFANHTSHLDALVVWASLPADIRERTRMVAAKDYWDAGPVRRHISKNVFNAILIDRENISIKNTPVKVMMDEMEERFSIIMFPEGGRSEGEEVGPFKSGLYYLAKKRPDLELIPVCLDNMNRILPRGRTLPVLMLSRVVFGPPIWLEQGESKEKFLDRTREAILKLKENWNNNDG
ncbi:MAG TPA: 1-acyl-sn-glycerol-3-phosphate acyltransferase [Planctomycetaceae bacterium]|nr:1-acyl-sn-glycerol-3-phosphate acyltransferase [Planctomycetaceae bacterium]